jgi:putative heme-binding domain-containing protein
MGQIGSIMKPAQIAEAIIRPNATISQGFQTALVSTTDGGSHIGFVTSRNSDEITLRDMTGNVTKIAVSKVKSEDHLPTSMMPPGLANSLSLEEFASMVAFLSEQK